MILDQLALLGPFVPLEDRMVGNWHIATYEFFLNECKELMTDIMSELPQGGQANGAKRLPIAFTLALHFSPILCISSP